MPIGGRWGRLPRTPSLRGGPKSYEVFCSYVVNIPTLVILNISKPNIKFVEIFKITGISVCNFVMTS